MPSPVFRSDAWSQCSGQTRGAATRSSRLTKVSFIEGGRGKSTIGKELKYVRSKTHLFVDWRVGPGGGSVLPDLSGMRRSRSTAPPYA